MKDHYNNFDLGDSLGKFKPRGPGDDLGGSGLDDISDTSNSSPTPTQADIDRQNTSNKDFSEKLRGKLKRNNGFDDYFK